MPSATNDRKKRILIVDRESVLATGLCHLLSHVPTVEVAALGCAERSDLAHVLRSFMPDIVVLPFASDALSAAEVAVLASDESLSRVVRISPDNNQACVYQLTQVPILGINDLLALIPST